MNYLEIIKGTVNSILPEFDPVFPGIPVQARYSPAFLSNCIQLENIGGIQTGMLYDAEGGSFSHPPAPEQAEPLPPPDPPPTESERLRADVDFLAAMAGVTL